MLRGIVARSSCVAFAVWHSCSTGLLQRHSQFRGFAPEASDRQFHQFLGSRIIVDAVGIQDRGPAGHPQHFAIDARCAIGSDDGLDTLRTDADLLAHPFVDGSSSKALHEPLRIKPKQQLPDPANGLVVHIPNGGDLAGRVPLQDAATDLERGAGREIRGRNQFRSGGNACRQCRRGETRIEGDTMVEPLLRHDTPGAPGR